MKCPKCNTENSDNAKFCRGCGNNLLQSQMAGGGRQPGNENVCPSCGSQLKPGAKFCAKCGSKIVSDASKSGGGPAPMPMPSKPGGGPAPMPMPSKSGGGPAPMPMPSKPSGGPAPMSMPSKSGGGPAPMPMPSKPGGSPAPMSMPSKSGGGPAPMPFEPGKIPAPSGEESDKTVMLFNEPSAGRPEQNKNTVLIQPDSPVPMLNPESLMPTPPERKKNNTGLVIAAVVLGIVILLAAVLAFFVFSKELPGNMNVPLINSLREKVHSGKTEKGEKTKEDSADAKDGGEQTKEDSEESEAPRLSDEEIAQILGPIDEMTDEGMEEIEDDEELYSGLEHLEKAISQYREAAPQINDSGMMNEKIGNAYNGYATGILNEIEILLEQPFDGGTGQRYGQMVDSLEDAISLGKELEEEGYSVNKEDLESRLETVTTDYPERVIEEFNRFTNDKLTENGTWSRTEAWELMSGTYAGGMFEEDDLDNPIRLRYAFALAYFIQRQNETELRDKLITPAAAAERIASQIADVDYSPLLIQYYIDYMHQAGKDCSEVESAYADVVNHLKNSQGFTLGKDMNLALFWYFNDFGEYSVDDWNGVTPENRQWIRDRMSAVEF